MGPNYAAQAYAIYTRQFGTASELTDETRSALVELYATWGRSEEARPFLDESVGLARKLAERLNASDADRALYAHWRDVEARFVRE